MSDPDRTPTPEEDWQTLEGAPVLCIAEQRRDEYPFGCDGCFGCNYRAALARLRAREGYLRAEISRLGKFGRCAIRGCVDKEQLGAALAAVEAAIEGHKDFCDCPTCEALRHYNEVTGGEAAGTPSEPKQSEPPPVQPWKQGQPFTPDEPQPPGDVTDPLHPTGRCRCGGEGRCDWCKEIERAGG